MLDYLMFSTRSADFLLYSSFFKYLSSRIQDLSLNGTIFHNGGDLTRETALVFSFRAHSHTNFLCRLNLCRIQFQWFEDQTRGTEKFDRKYPLAI